MIIILIFLGFILLFRKKEDIKRLLGFSFIIFGVIFVFLSFTDVIPRQTVVTIQKIVPMKNDLNPSEKFYFYDDGDTVTYYTLNQKEMKFSSNIVKYEVCNTSDSHAYVKTVEFKPMWLFILGYQISKTTEVIINISKNYIEI